MEQAKKPRAVKKKKKRQPYKKPYIPTPEEIRAECLKIQSEWTPEEELERRGGNPFFRIPTARFREERA
jgi:hypothetical protein